MRAKRSTVAAGLPLIAVIPLINVLFLLLIFLTFAPLLTAPDIVQVKLPKAMTSDVLRNDNIIITVTGENVIYVGDRIVAEKDLQAHLSRRASKDVSVLIKADRRSSVGRVVDVWNMCRILGIDKVNIASNQEQ